MQEEAVCIRPRYNANMRYLVRGRVKPGRETDLLEAIERCTLGRGSVAEGEYLRNMKDARLFEDQTSRWVEVCYCPSPLLEERPYWEQYFYLTRVQDAHDRRRCRDENGGEPWACSCCDGTERLERRPGATRDAFTAWRQPDQKSQRRDSPGGPPNSTHKQSNRLSEPRNQ